MSGPPFPHLAAGDPLPYVRDGSVLLLSMAFCPYAHRVQLVLAAKGIQFDIVNCNLENKPEFLLDRNPKGRIPTIDRDGQVLWESEVICNLLENWYPDVPLYPDVPFEKAKDQAFVAEFAKIFPIFRKIMLLKGDEDADYVTKTLEDFTKIFMDLNNELKMRGSLYLGGNDKPGMIDYLCWPWIERSTLLEATESVTDEGMPELRQYITEMFKIKLIVDISALYKDNYREFVTAYATTGKRKYEF